MLVAMLDHVRPWCLLGCLLISSFLVCCDTLLIHIAQQVMQERNRKCYTTFPAPLSVTYTAVLPEIVIIDLTKV